MHARMRGCTLLCTLALPHQGKATCRLLWLHLGSHSRSHPLLPGSQGPVDAGPTPTLPSLPSHSQGPWPAQDRPPPEATPGRLPHQGVQSLHQVRLRRARAPRPSWAAQIAWMGGLGCALVSCLAWAGSGVGDIPPAQQCRCGRYGERQHALPPQVWLCHYAEVTQRGHRCETVGTTLDQELPVWWAVAESASQLFLSRSRQPACVQHRCRGLSVREHCPSRH